MSRLTKANEVRLGRQRQALRDLYSDWQASGLSKRAYAKEHGTTQDRIRSAVRLVEREADLNKEQALLPLT